MPGFREPGLIVFTLEGAVDRADVPALCARLRVLLESGMGEAVVCDVGRLIQIDLPTVDALARLQLTARRYGRPVRLRQASAELQGIIALVGMSEILPLELDSALEPRRQPKERE